MATNDFPVALLKIALQTQGRCQIRVDGSSMHPTLREGDHVEVIRINYCDLYPSQVIAFTMEGEVVVHRICYRVPLGYITAGDNNNILLDNPITEKEYLGVVESIVLPDGSRKSLLTEASKKICTSIETRATIPDTLVYLPDQLVKNQSEADIQFTSLKVRPLSILDLQQSYCFLGISPNGLLEEEQFLKVFKGNSNLSLICLANFGPDRANSDYLSVNSVRGVYRLDFFNHWWNIFPHRFIPSALLCYIDALIRGASHVSN